MGLFCSVNIHLTSNKNRHSLFRLYDVNQHTFRQMYKHGAPVLDCCFPVGLKNDFLESKDECLGFFESIQWWFRSYLKSV
jgi:hypothetical protein